MRAGEKYATIFYVAFIVGILLLFSYCEAS